MQRAILFRYHDHLDVCANRIALLRRVNPDCPIYGLYGGQEPAHPLNLLLDDDYVAPFEKAQFKWEHGDLCIREWFRDRGRHHPFDMLHVVEWDLILLKPLAELLAHVTEGVAVSARLTLAEFRKEGWGWITNPDRAEQFDRLTDFIRARYRVRIDYDAQFAGPFGGAAMSRDFLERYAHDEVPLLLHDEIRMPVFATAFGMTVHDTGFNKANPFWNCNKRYYAPEDVYSAAAKGAAIFHPVKEALDFKRLFSPSASQD